MDAAKICVVKGTEHTVSDQSRQILGDVVGVNIEGNPNAY